MVLPKEKPCIHPIYFGITSFPTTIINNNFNDVFFRRLRRLLTFDQISLFLIAEIIRKFFDVFQCNAIESYIQKFRYRKKHKKCANYLSRTKTHHICTDTCLSFLYFSSCLTTSTYTKAKEAHHLLRTIAHVFTKRKTSNIENCLFKYFFQYHMLDTHCIDCFDYYYYQCLQLCRLSSGDVLAHRTVALKRSNVTHTNTKTHMNTQTLLIEDVCIVLSYIAVFSYYYTIIIMQCFNTHAYDEAIPEGVQNSCNFVQPWNILILSFL